MFQDPFDVFNPFYRIDHVLTTPVRRYGLAHSDAEARQLIEEALSRVGLRPQDTLGRFPHELSGGQRQRVMVARAVLLKPRLIVADEPVSMVDASLRATILDELRTLNRDLDISIVYITHDPDDGVPDLRQHRHPLSRRRGRGRFCGTGDRRSETSLFAAAGLLDPAAGPLQGVGK